MKFIDVIDIYVASGKGGNGCLSFSREKSLLHGYPDGGNGGRGGHVFFIGSKSVTTFSHLKFKAKYKAGNGFNGKSNKKTGKNGKNLIIYLPLGTIIYDKETNIIIGELLYQGQSFLVANGGSIGYGNVMFGRGKNKITCGGSSMIRFLHLEMRLLADIGLLGTPNVGKSSFVSCVSNVFSKIGDYEFTTLYPVLGAIDRYCDSKVVVADIPGIIKGASFGKGLGLQFLKHLSRTELLLHFVDCSIVFNDEKLEKELNVIFDELKKFSVNLSKKEKWLVFNKIDLLDKNLFLECVDRFNYNKVFYISCLHKIGLNKLCFNFSEYVNKYRHGRVK